MKIAVEGCAHGELDKIYESIQFLEKQEDIKVDLLICCGDFQSTRNKQDLRCMAVPAKYQKMCTFYKYYSGEKTAPILTIFIGGNHEASNYLQELAYGGWVAPNIYYMGYASVVNVGGVRIGGISGIYKGHDYMKGHFEKAPYTEETKRSVYHVRNLEVFRLKQVKEPIDIMFSHDWPRGIYNYGNVGNLLEMKPFFMEDIQKDKLGSKPCEELLHELKPKFWFSAHLHVKFVAIVPHPQDGGKKKVTKFLALDKCLPKRKFLQILDIPSDADKPIQLKYDLEWLTIVHLTNHLLSVKKGFMYMPGKSNHERWIFTPTSEEQTHVLNRFGKDLEVPLNFTRTVVPFDENSTPKRDSQVIAQINPQTMLFCERLGVNDPMAVLLEQLSKDSTPSRMSLPSFLTPDKSENLSQWSSPQSQSDEVTSIDNLDLSLNSSNSSQIMKRSSLSMPAPKLCTNDEDYLPLTQETTVSSSPEESNDEKKSKSLTSSKCSSLSMPAPKLSTNSEDFVVPFSRETTVSSLPEEMKSKSLTSSKCSSLSMPAPKLSTNSEDFVVPFSRETTMSSLPEEMKSKSLTSSKCSTLSMPAPKLSTNSEDFVVPFSRETTMSSLPEEMKSESLTSSKCSSLSMPAPKLSTNSEDFVVPFSRETTMSSLPEEMKSESLTSSKCSSLSMPAPKLSTNSEDFVVPFSRETTMSSLPEEMKSESLTSSKCSSLSMPAPKLSTNSEDFVPLSRETTMSSLPEEMKSESLTSNKYSSLSLLAPRILDDEIVHPVTEKSKSPRSDRVDEASGPVADIQQDQAPIPVIKKFKRRNQALYTNIEED